MQELVQLEVLAEAISRCHSATNSSKLNKFLHNELNLLIQHIIVRDQDGQNNKMKSYIARIISPLLILKMFEFYIEAFRPYKVILSICPC